MAIAIPRTAPKRASRASRIADRERVTTLQIGPSRTARVIAMTLLAVIALIWLSPTLWAILTSLKTEADANAVPLTIWPEHGLTLEHYRFVLGSSGLITWMWNSAFTSVIVTVVTVAISALAAYALSRLDFKGRRLLQAVTLMSIMVPTQILLIPLYQEFQLAGLIDTYWAVILPQVVGPVYVLILKRFFDTIPTELEEAAQLDGANRLRIFLTVVLPLSRSIIAAVAIFTFISTWNNYMWPYLVTNDPSLMTLPVGIGSVKSPYGVAYAQVMASAVVAAAPLLVIFMFFQRQIVKGIATTGLAGQ